MIPIHLYTRKVKYLLYLVKKRMTEKEMAGLNNQPTLKNLTIETLNERMNAVLGKKPATQPAEKIDKPQEPQVVKENIFSQYDPYELLVGAIVELEHTNDVIEALKIATDHLDEIADYYTKLLNYVETEEQVDIEAKEYQTPGGSGINVGRMIKNMSRPKTPKFDSKRNLADRFKTMFKMRSPKDDMNAALQTRESYTVVGRFEDETQASNALKALLIKKRDAQLLKDKDGINIIIVKD